MVSRILLADDSITIQKVVSLTFADEGIEVVAVSNGEMAARRLEEVNPDLVLADIFMPGKNGYELCEAIKTDSKFCKVPVVLLVGAFEPFDQVEARRVQADAHLTKPFESRTLVETVRKLLGTTDRPDTGHLAPASPAHQEAPASVEGTNSWVAPALIDSTAPLEFESASGQWTAGDMPGADSGASSPAVETMPLDLGPLGTEAYSYVQSDEAPPSGSELLHEETLWERTPGEFVSRPDGAEPSDQSSSPDDQPVTAPDQSVEVETSAVVEQTEESPLALETQASTFDTPPEGVFNQEQMVVDFDTSLPATTAAETGAPVLDVDTNGAGFDSADKPGSDQWLVEDVQHAANEWRVANSLNLNTTKLEMRDFSDDVRASLEARKQDATGSSFSEAAPGAESASLFAAEEPLGDVLFGSGREPQTASSASASPLEETALTEFTLELAPGGPPALDPVSAPALVDQLPESESERITGELVTADLPMEGQMVVESAARDFVADEVFEPLAEAPQWVDPEVQSVTTDEPISGDVSPGDFVSYDWTSPDAVIHSTGRLDSTAMPVAFAESSENPGQQEDLPQPTSADAPPDESLNWEAAQMRFAAIDMEESPVEEGDARAQQLQSSDRERGFEISQSIVDDRSPDLNENRHREANETPLSPVELSPMAIDEIVRRVVAQIGDSIVREIAWEIVPDCVERIIEQQTRAALAKR
jgi:CheY-like chemotaxis protein